MKIEFIIPTYNRPKELITIISSIRCQTNDNWKIHVIADGVYDGYEDVKKMFSEDNKIKFSELETNSNDWGHTPRNYGLEHATEEWVVMTGDDNYYVPIFVDEFLKSSNFEDVNFVYCDMVHNWSSNEYVYLRTTPVLNNIDIGCYMTKTTLSKQLKLDTRMSNADGKFVMEYNQKFGNKTLKINKILYVHN